MEHTRLSLPGKRYIVHETIGRGAMGTVYRATDRLTGQFVALKSVNQALRLDEDASDATDLTLTLAREFQTLASLRHPNIISVYDYGLDADRQPFYTMTLLLNPRDIRMVAAGCTNREKVQLIIELLQALAYLHQRGVIHRDLKPGNVLVDNDGIVKVVDFGLAAAKDVSQNLAGTLAYIAPETLKGTPAGIASDLYAVGVIAFEIFTGVHPYPAAELNELIYHIIQFDPDWSLLPSLDSQANVPPTITTTPLSSQTMVLNEQVFQDDGTMTLNNMRYSGADVEHPPTEFDNPFTIRAIVARLMSKNPGRRFQSARETIQALCVAANLPEPEETVVVRNSYLQAAQFIGREFEMQRLKAALDNALESEGSSWLIGGESGVGKSRLLNEVRTLALVQGMLTLQGQMSQDNSSPFQAWREPLRNLLLEVEPSEKDVRILKTIMPDIDLLVGYAVEEAPAVDEKIQNQRIAATITDLFTQQERPILLILEDLHWAHESLIPLQRLTEAANKLPLLIVASYRDDERPDLLFELPEMRVLQLERFTKEEIEALSVSMIGDEGRDPRVLDFLIHETEGNAFFMVEVVRALAEGAGKLSDIGRQDLPQRIFAGGVRNVLNRRLSALSDKQLGLLQLAAIIGRDINVPLLEKLTEQNVAQWLYLCADIMILEVHEGRWRFVHDYLRDTVLDQLLPEDSQRLHEKIATTIEESYGDKYDEYIFKLVEYWARAGNPQKELYYRLLVGEQLFKLGQMIPAQQAFSAAYELLPPEDYDRRLPILLRLAEINENIGAYPQAIEHFEFVIDHTKDKQLRLDALNGLASVGYLQGEYKTGEQYATQALALAQTVNDLPRLAQSLSNMGNFALIYGNITTAGQYFRRSLDIREKLSDEQGRAITLHNIANVMLTLNNFVEAEDKFLESLHIQQTIGDRQGAATNLSRLGWLARHQGRFVQAEQYHDQSLAIQREIGDRYGIANTLHHMGRLVLHQDEIAVAAYYLREALSEAHQIKASNLMLQVCVGISDLLIKESQFQLATELIGLAISHPATSPEVMQDAIGLLDQLRTQLDNEKIEQYLSNARDADLEPIINYLLAHLSK